MKLEIKNLSFRYSAKSPDVLQDVNLTFDKGEVVGLLGPNGAGKTTLLYLIAGALTPGEGTVEYEYVSTRRRCPSVLSDIYLVAEEAQLPRLTLENYVKLYSRFYPHFDQKIMDEAMREFRLESPQRLDQLSMGQKKKVLLSFAFACNTPVVLFDEPTNGLDIPGKSTFRRLVAKYCTDERLILISTHQVRDLDMILDRVTVMNFHNVVVNASMLEIQRRFKFVTGASEKPEGAIYALPSPAGVDYMEPNTEGSDTEVNLELLFGAAMENPTLINQKNDHGNSTQQ